MGIQNNPTYFVNGQFGTKVSILYEALRNLLKCASVRQNSQIFPSPIWLPSVNLYESTVPFSEKVSIVTPPYPNLNHCAGVS